MSGPWEKYQSVPDQPSATTPAPAADGPWSKYAAPSAEPAKTSSQQLGESQPGIVKGLISTLQGPAMGFADELAGVGGAITGAVANLTPYGDGKSFVQNYKDTRDAARAASDSHMKENPVLGHAERIAASLPVIMATPAVQAAQRTGLVAAALPESVKAGVKYGAVSGLGESKEDNVKGLAEDAALSAGTAGALGPVFNGIARGTGAVANNIAQRIASTQTGRNILGSLTEAGQEIAQNATNAGRSLASMAANGEGGIRDAVAGALENGGKRIGGLVESALSSTDGGARRLAMQKVGEAIDRDQAGPADSLSRAAARIQKLGDEATVADSAGQNTKQLLDTLATLPGNTKDAAERLIRGRQAGRADRLTDAAEAGLSPNGARLPETLEALDAARSAAAAPLYDQVRATNLPVDGDLRGIIGRARSAFGQAKELAKVNGQKFDMDQLEPGMNALMMSTPKNIPLSQLDTLKRTLYDIEQGHINPETGRLTEIGNAYKNLRRDLTDKIDSLTTDTKTGQSFYKAARDAYAGPSELRTAANLGSQAMSKDAWKIGQMTDGMSDSELQAFRIGAFESLRKKFGTEGGQTQILKMWKEPATAEKLKELFADQGTFRQFAADVAKEARLKGLESVGRGSQTAARSAGMGDLDMAAIADAGNVARSAATGNITGIASGVSGLWNRVKTPESVRDEMGGILMSKGQKGAQNIREIKSLVQLIREEKAQKAAQAGRFAGLL